MSTPAFDLESIMADWGRYTELSPAFKRDSTDERAEDDRTLVEGETSPCVATKLSGRARERELLALQAAVRAKIEQLVGNSIWQEKGSAGEGQWTVSPRTMLKTIQEILSHPAERMAFDCKESLEGGIAGIIIDPRRLTEQLLKNLGLAQYLPEKGTRHSEAEKVGHRALAIPAVREMLGSLEPIRLPQQRRQDLRYFRLMRVAKGQNEGSVVGTQNIEGQKTLFKTDLYGAKRRILHIEAGYAGEIEKLKLIQLTLETVRDGLGEWSDIKNTAQLEELRQKLIEAADSLQFVRDEHKVALRCKIGEALTFRDSKGRSNPGRSRAKLVSAETDIGARMRSIERIWGYLGGDKAKVNELIKEQEAPMKDFLGITETLHERFKILRNRPMEGTEKDQVRTNLFKLRTAAQKQKFEPHLSFGRKWVEQINKVITAIEHGDHYSVVQKEFVKVYLLAKIFRTYTQLRDVYEKVSLLPREVDPRQLLEQVQAIDDDLSKKKVAAGLSTPEYDKAYGEIYHLFNSIKSRLRGLINPPIPVKEEEEHGKEQAPKREKKNTTLDGILLKLRGIPLLGKVIRGIEERVRGFLRSKHGTVEPEMSRHAVNVPPPTAEPEVSETAPPDPQAVLRVCEEIRERMKGFSFEEVVGRL